VVNLKPGEALLFSPSAMLRVTKVIRKGITTEKVKKLGMHYMKIRVRKRLTADGGGVSWQLDEVSRDAMLLQFESLAICPRWRH
jgi:hypothetical protein